MIYTKTKLSEYTVAFSAIFFIGIILSAPSVCARGARYGLNICADILIPSLFPFSIPVLFLINTNAYINSKRKILILFVLSLLGGYPIGAKLIAELYNSGIIKQEYAKKLIPFCVNAGPAFIIIAVGKSILGSVKIGCILLFSHVLASVLLFVMFYIRTPYQNKKYSGNNSEITVSDNIVLSVHNASNACLSICAFVVMFSVVNQYLLFYSDRFGFLKHLMYLTEVTSAVNNTKNIYIISFLLSFSGISIWMQIYSMSTEIKPNIYYFVSVRILHGILSTLFTVIMIKACKISIYTISNNQAISERLFYSDYYLSISLLIMVFLLIISVSSKKHSGNLIKDML